ncbi:MAG TPA: ABC-type transport auxiliary lipoprotein family protein [Gammaproteobacteria bacterium]|nr:ABC-type transport auxiliary lipoprotein family protein [Gammaproteobacteria bacterium]
MRKLFALTLPLLLVAGCSGLFTPKSLPTSEYALAPTVASAAVPARSCAAVLRVNSVQVAQPWGSSNILYTQTPYQVSSFAYHRWAAPPATMLGDAITKALAASELYRGVLGPTDPGNGDLTLAIRLLRGPVQSFPGSQSGAAAPAASTEALGFAASLSVSDTGRLLASREFSASTAAAPNPYGGVVAANKLAGDLIARLIGWLASVDTASVCATP